MCRGTVNNSLIRISRVSLSPRLPSRFLIKSLKNCNTIQLNQKPQDFAIKIQQNELKKFC